MHSKSIKFLAFCLVGGEEELWAEATRCCQSQLCSMDTRERSLITKFEAMTKSFSLLPTQRHPRAHCCRAGPPAASGFECSTTLTKGLRPISTGAGPSVSG